MSCLFFFLFVVSLLCCKREHHLLPPKTPRRMITVAAHSHDTCSDVLLCQGAEGKVYLSSFCGKRAIVKERLSKSYRVPMLDRKINKQRMQQEIRCMVKCRRSGVCTPLVYFVDQSAYRMTLEYIEGVTIKQFLLDTSKCAMFLLGASVFSEFTCSKC